MHEVILVGQTPPPFGGQAVLIDMIVKHRFERVRITHVRMDLTREMGELGRFQTGKIARLVSIVWQVYRARRATGATVLFYPPSGPERLPVLRDVVVLLAVRWLFRRTVFYFFAGGASDYVASLPSLLRGLARRAYARPDCAIRMSDRNPPDGQRFGARHEALVPGSVFDRAAGRSQRTRPTSARPRLLYLGLLCESKGVSLLLEAARRLAAGGSDFELHLVGEYASEAYREEVERDLTEPELAQRVRVLHLTGEHKWGEYADADVFCFPSHFPSETFGLVLLEAMQFGLPVVATRWRGIPDIVEPGETGLLVPVGDAKALAEGIGELLADPGRAREMGRAGRVRYLERFHPDAWFRMVEDAIVLGAEG